MTTQALVGEWTWRRAGRGCDILGDVEVSQAGTRLRFEGSDIEGLHFVAIMKLDGTQLSGHLETSVAGKKSAARPSRIEGEVLADGKLLLRPEGFASRQDWRLERDPS